MRKMLRLLFVVCMLISTSTVFAQKTITIKGKVKGLASGQDWDSAYEQVSGIIQFVN